MTIYRYNVSELEETRSGLATLHDDFDQASATRDGYAEAMGYGVLKDATNEFTDNWKKNREKQLESLAGAVETLGQIVTNYVDFDRGARDELYKGQ